MSGSWNLQPAGQAARDAGPRVVAARLGATYQMQASGGRRHVSWNGKLRANEVEPLLQAKSANGRLEGHTIHAQTSSVTGNSVRVTVTFALPAERPFLLRRVTVHNDGAVQLNLTGIDLVRVGPSSDNPPARLALGPECSTGSRPPRLAFFCNGCQSWSFAGALRGGSRQPHYYLWPTGRAKRSESYHPALSPGRPSDG